MRGYPPDPWNTDYPSEDEVTDFIASNPLLDQETIDQLTIPGLLGFHNTGAVATEEWLTEFESKVKRWAEESRWLSADLPWLASLTPYSATESEVWTPGSDLEPLWIRTSPSSLLVAADLLSRGRLLSDLHWREFEELIGNLLERDGWKVEVTQGTRDGGIDVIASRSDPILGPVKSIWQAKKYAPNRRVRLSEVRELAGILEREHATKALIVTTSHLSRDALAWIRRDVFRLGLKEQEDVERWVWNALLGQIRNVE